MNELEKPEFKPTTKERMGNFLRIFGFVFLAALIFINWGTIREIFNYKAIYGDIIDSLKSRKEVVIKVPEVELNEPKFTEKPDGIEIPKIGITAPLIFSEGNDNKDFSEALKRGVVYYPQSVLPGEEGQTVILGHSAPIGWPNVNYDWIFSRINELEKGDEIFVYFNHRHYVYIVNEKFILNQGDEIPKLTNSKTGLTLLSCWPPGVNYRRLAVQAEILK